MPGFEWLPREVSAGSFSEANKSSGNINIRLPERKRAGNRTHKAMVTKRRKEKRPKRAERVKRGEKRKPHRNAVSYSSFELGRNRWNSIGGFRLPTKACRLPAEVKVPFNMFLRSKDYVSYHEHGRVILKSVKEQP